jgi:hypothetical protein
LLQRLRSESLADFGQSRPLRVRQSQSASSCARRILFSAARYSFCSRI